MSTQQQIDAYQSAIDQKQQELAGQEFTLRVQQEELVKAEQARLLLQRTQPPRSEATAAQRQALRDADDAESNARIAAAQTSDNIAKLQGSIRYNTAQKQSFEASRNAQPAPTSTVADNAVNARTDAAEVAPAPVPAALAAQSPPAAIAAETAAAPAPLTVLAEAPPALDNTVVPVDVEANTIQSTTAEPQAQFVYDENTGEMIPADSAQAQEILAEQPSVYGPEPVPAGPAGNNPDEVDSPAAGIISPDQQQANEQAAAKVKAINQATLQSRYKQPGTSDWRVRLQLAPRSDYLYNASPPGILKPLAETNGVIFPYTPQVNTSYKANYEQYDLVHSNYRGVYYKNSRVDDVAIRGTFTAQDTREADYLLAVIHFFRSVTKMFYGKDTERGTPPPLVYLSGYGMNQFNGHPCVVSNFTYNLPDNVDYIRATNVNDYGTNLLSRRTATSAGGQAGLGATGNRILNAGLGRFFPQTSPTPDTVVGSVNNTQLANYVPTKMEIDITLIPVQTRSQVSKQFSLKSFANGDLIKGGFW
jgi:hypothetical protein